MDAGQLNVIKNMLSIRKEPSTKSETEHFEQFALRTWKVVKPKEFGNVSDADGAQFVLSVLYHAGIELTKTPIEGYEPLVKLRTAASSAQSGDTTMRSDRARSPSPVSSRQPTTGRNREVPTGEFAQAATQPLPQGSDSDRTAATSSGSGGTTRSRETAAASSGAARQATSSGGDAKSSSSLATEDVDVARANGLTDSLKEFMSRTKCQLPNLEVTKQKVFATLKVDVANKLIDFLEEIYGDVKQHIIPSTAGKAPTSKDKQKGLNEWRKHHLRKE